MALLKRPPMLDNNGQPVDDGSQPDPTTATPAMQVLQDTAAPAAGFQGSGAMSLRPNVGQRMPPSLEALLQQLGGSY